jgi:hypothetical protein
METDCREIECKGNTMCLGNDDWLGRGIGLGRGYSECDKTI